MENNSEHILKALVDITEGYRKIWDKCSTSACLTPEYIKAQRAIRLHLNMDKCNTCNAYTGDLGFCPRCDTQAYSH